MGLTHHGLYRATYTRLLVQIKQVINLLSDLPIGGVFLFENEGELLEVAD